MTQPSEIDVAAEELRAQLHRALLVARFVAQRTGVARRVSHGVRAVPVLATRWPREAVAARWAAASVNREQAQRMGANLAAAADEAFVDQKLADYRRIEADRSAATREAMAWDERVAAAGVDPEQVREEVRREFEQQRNPQPAPDQEQQPGPEARPGPGPEVTEDAERRPVTGTAVGEELVTEYLAEAYTVQALDDLDTPPAPSADPSVGDLIAATELRGGQVAPGESSPEPGVDPGVDTALDPDLDPAFDPGRDTSAGRGVDDGVGW